MRSILDSVGGRNSVYPPIHGLTFSPFIYMVPQFDPEDVLMLGYAGGTVAGLIRLFYGQAVPIVAVDLHDPVEDLYNVMHVKADARDYVKRPDRKFDVVVVDVYEDGTSVPCGFVTDPEFVDDLKNAGRFLIVHAKDSTDMGVYGDPLKVLALNESRFYYYMVERIGRVPIR